MFNIDLRPNTSARIIGFLFLLIFLALSIYSVINYLQISIFLVIGPLIGVKYFQGLLVSRISIEKNKIILNRTLGKKLYNVNNIVEIGLRTINTAQFDSPVNEKFIEFKLDSGKLIIYKVRLGRNILRKGELESIIGIKVNKLTSLNPYGLKGLKYIWFYLWV